MAEYEHRSLDDPDERRTFENGHMELLKIGGGEVGRVTLEPGWRWSEHVKPIAGTDWCEAPHFQYVLSGRMHVVSRDGQELDVAAGEVAVIPPGHDAWVVGDEPVVAVDWSGLGDYAK